MVGPTRSSFTLMYRHQGSDSLLDPKLLLLRQSDPGTINCFKFIASICFYLQFSSYYYQSGSTPSFCPETNEWQMCEIMFVMNKFFDQLQFSMVQCVYCGV